MSKPSATVVYTVLLGKEIELYFEALCLAHGWSEPDVTKLPWGFRLTTGKTVVPIGFPPTPLELRIELAWKDKGHGLWLCEMYFHGVEEFPEVDLGRLLLNPKTFLSFQGLEFHSINPEITLQRNRWEINGVRDFAALLENYDHGARRLNCLTLFE